MSFQDKILSIAEPEIIVSEAHERIARIVKDYSPDLDLVFIPPNKREPGDIPFAVTHRSDGRPPYVVLTSETCDETIIERLILADNNVGNVLTRLDAHNLAVELVEARRLEDQHAEAADLAWHIMKSPLNVYKHNGVKYQ
jgi:hypothetical protein